MLPDTRPPITGPPLAEYCRAAPVRMPVAWPKSIVLEPADTSVAGSMAGSVPVDVPTSPAVPESDPSICASTLVPELLPASALPELVLPLSFWAL
jgi:hypothetical protein